MPPSDTSPQSVNRYFKRLLAALVIQAGGELRIPQKFIRQVTEESSPQALFEDSNIEEGTLVLRYGTKNSAVYTVEPEPCTDSRKPQSPTSQIDPLNQPKNPALKGRPPLTEEQLAKVEQAARRMRANAILKRSIRPENSSETSEPNFPV